MALRNKFKHVSGKNCGEVIVYALSTCQWCRKTKGLLKKMKVEYDYIDVDLLSKAEEHELHELFHHMKLEMNFPVTIVDDKNVIVGFQEDKIRKLSK